ncbi:MAG: hypothetical protein ABIZ91_06980 [Gemmatimonadaceae bacterium]
MIQPADVAMAAIVMGTASGTILSLARMFLNRGARRPDALAAGERDGRLDRLELAIDAIAVEVERLSESQRFTARLLAERLPASDALPPATRT